MGLMIVGTEMRALGLGLSVLKSVRDVGGDFANAFSLSAYLFPPLWLPLFFGGALVAWIYEISNLEKSKSKLPGIACDVLTLLFAGRFVIDVVGGIGQPHLQDYWGNAAVPDFFASDPVRRRTWVAMLSQLYMPLVYVWIWLLAMGKGWTAHALSNETLVTVFAPAAYNEYLLHQVVAQWYFWVSRGRPWSWWSERKAFYWFSPSPLPVSWPETFVVIVLSIVVAKWFTKHVDTRLTPLWMRVVNRILGAKNSDDLSAEELVSSVLEDITGSDVDLEATLAEAGLVSIGLPMLISMLNEAHPKVALTLKEVADCATIQDLVDCVAKFLGANEAGMENEPIGYRLTSSSQAVGRSVRGAADLSAA